MNKRKSIGIGHTVPMRTEHNKMRNTETSSTDESHNNSKNVYSVNETQCIYICQNATNKEHECDFGICKPCYVKEAPKKLSRKRKQDVDDSICNHLCISSLQQFFDKQYFEKDYIANCKKRDISWTTNCAKCNARFVSMNRNGKMK